MKTTHYILWMYTTYNAFVHNYFSELFCSYYRVIGFSHDSQQVCIALASEDYVGASTVDTSKRLSIMSCCS